MLLDIVEKYSVQKPLYTVQPLLLLILAITIIVLAITIIVITIIYYGCIDLIVSCRALGPLWLHSYS